MAVTVYGASDDLIEIEGDVDEEFYAIEFGHENESEGGFLAFSDGTILRIVYDGIWRITPIAKGSSDIKVDLAMEDDEDNYSDRATLSGKIKWVVLGSQKAHSK